jgi:hypothetical protein
MKAKHAGRNNPYKSKKKKKASHKKQFLGTDVRTVTQLVELKCSKRRKLQIASQLLKYAEEVQGLESSCGMNKIRLELANEAVRDWKKAVKELKAEIRSKNIERSKVHTPFASLLK